MSVRSRRNRRSRRARFGAPWGRAVKLTTWGSLLTLAMVSVLPQLVFSRTPQPWWVHLLAPIVLGVGLGVVSLFSVRGFIVQGRELWIQRPLWQTRVALHNLKHAQIDSTAMRRTWRTLGNGGLFAFTGWFRNKKLGKYRAFVTDQARCVVMEFGDRKLVVSPDDPEGFLNALGFETDSSRILR